MSKKIVTFHKIQKKIGLYFSFTTIIVLLLTISIYFVFVSKNIRQTTRNHLLDIISISVINIDAEIHKTLTKPEQENNKAYLQLKKDLQKIRDASHDIHFIYTMRFNEQNGITFVVDAEENPENIAHLCEKYTEASQFLKDNIESIDKPIVEENFYTDKWGMWLTGYAPFYDSKGNIEGILAIDIEAKIVKSYERKVLFLAIFILVIIFPIVYFIGFRIGKKIARPIEILTKGALAIADGNLDLEIPQTTNDEIGLLAESFNKMSKQLREFFENKEKIISERTKEIEAGENNLSSLFNAMTDLVMEMDYDGRYITIAPTSPELMFQLPENVAGKTLHEVFPKSEADLFLKFIQSVIDQNKTLTIEYPLTIANKTYWFEGKATPKTKNTVLYIARDVTKRKQAEAELTKLSAAVTQSPSIILITDLDANLEYVNPKFTDLTGYSSKEVQGLNPKILNAGTLSDEFYKDLWETISSGKKWRGEFHNKKKNGELFWESASISPIFDSENNIINYVKVSEDITEKKRTDQELLKMEKLRSIGTLAGGIAHDFNNILAGIYGYVSLALMKLEENHPSHRYLAETEKSLDRATKLTRQLLTFSKGGAPIKKDVNLTKIIEETVIFDLSGSNVKPVFNFAENLMNANIDKSQIQQVFSNLAVNANQASPDGGHLYISVTNSFVKNNEVLDLIAGEYLKITVQDEGTGIPQKYIDKIFDPYFTTKATGNGLGLATTYSIIKKHKGYLGIDSELGKGTTFTIYLPASKIDEITNEEKSEKQVTEQIHSAKILVMDDEEVLRSMASQMIQLLGYEVDSASDGKETITKYKEAIKQNKPFDIVIADLTIPGGMGGKETVKKILEIDKNAKVIVSSGYTSGSELADYKALGFIDMIDKPYMMAKLKEVLNRVLNDDELVKNQKRTKID